MSSLCHPVVHAGDAALHACTALISVATAPYDGYEPERMFESLARVGVTHVDLSDPIGYSERLDEKRYSPSSASIFAATLERHGLKCYAVSAHLNLLVASERAELERRLNFAARIGARVVNTSAGDRHREREAVVALRWAAGLAAELGLKIGLENPADGRDSLFNVAADAPHLLDRIGSASVGLTYDVGNTVSHRPGIDPVDDALAALPHCIHVHVKDLNRQPAGWFYAAIGTGYLDLADLVRAATRRKIPISIELPLRQYRLLDGMLGRSRYRVALRDIETIVATSLQWLKDCASSAGLVERACA